jgi:TolB-like protein
MMPLINHADGNDEINHCRHLCDLGHISGAFSGIDSATTAGYYAKKDKKLNFRFSDFDIDVARYELRQAGKAVPVEPQVFDLLVYLVRNCNRIVSKDELIDAVWQGRIVSEAAFSSRLSAARRALGDDGVAQIFIRTHYKRGFSFVGKVQQQSAPAESTGANSVQQPIQLVAAPAIVRSDRPYIAVLPFRNISGHAEQERFAGGLTEDVITGLTRQPWISVINLNSHSATSDDTVDLRQVASDLGVRYAFEGSVRAAADRVRVTGRLIDASSNVHVWADRYDCGSVNSLARQDQISNQIVDAVTSQIIVAEAAHLRRKPTEDTTARDLVIQALPHMWRTSMAEHLQAQELLKRAVKLDQKCAHAHALLGWTYASMFNLNANVPISELTDGAIDAGAKAVTFDEQAHWGHLVLGIGHARRRRPEEAVAHISKAVALNPNFALGHAGLGYAFACGGDPKRGLESLREAQRLSPLDPFLAMYAPVVRYMASFAMHDYEETVAVCRSMTTRHPNHVGARRLMTVSLGLLGREDEARDSLARTLTLQPNLSSDHVAKDTVFANASDRSRFLLGLQKAGLKG